MERAARELEPALCLHHLGDGRGEIDVRLLEHALLERGARAGLRGAAGGGRGEQAVARGGERVGRRDVDERDLAELAAGAR